MASGIRSVDTPSVVMNIGRMTSAEPGIGGAAIMTMISNSENSEDISEYWNLSVQNFVQKPYIPRINCCKTNTNIQN